MGQRMTLLSFDAFNARGRALHTLRSQASCSPPGNAGLSARHKKWALAVVWAWAIYVTLCLGLLAHGSPWLMAVCRVAP